MFSCRLKNFTGIKLLLILLLTGSLQGALAPGACPQASAHPKLVLVLVASQFSYDFLARYADKFAPGGFKLLRTHGANFSNCKYGQANTQAACGHSIISTGAYPWATGIVGNAWYDRRKGKVIDAVFDDTEKLVGGNGPAGSTRAMLGTTIGDEMKLASNGLSKVFTISMQDKNALFLAGRLANNAFWLDSKTGCFVTSSQYGQELPLWIKSFNDQHLIDSYFGKAWQRLLPESQYSASSRDDYPWERPMASDGRQFPHVITGGAASPGDAYYTTFRMTPWANQMVADLARQAIDKENLGSHNDADFLGLNFSAGDLSGQYFGPYSQEVEDIVLRLDQTLSCLFQYVDQKIGLNNCLIVFTADQGAMPIPEWLKEKGMDAGRIDPKSFKNLLNTALSSRLGSAQWIESFVPPNLYLNLETIDKQKYRQPDVEALTAKLARTVAGVGEVYTAVQFFLNELPTGPHVEAVKKNYYGLRSGELIVLTRPGYVFTTSGNGTGSGSLYGFDAQVPLMLYGSGIQGGLYGRSATPADIAPTIAALLGIQAPSLSQGRVLYEAVGQDYGPFLSAPSPSSVGSSARKDASLRAALSPPSASLSFVHFNAPSPSFSSYKRSVGCVPCLLRASRRSAADGSSPPLPHYYPLIAPARVKTFRYVCNDRQAGLAIRQQL